VTETSGLEGDARADISPINSKPLVLALRSKGTSRGETDALIRKDPIATINRLIEGYGLRLAKQLSVTGGVREGSNARVISVVRATDRTLG